jgi:hypothetical protein
MSITSLDHDVAFDNVDAHRHAYNAAFYELGLKWHWDSEFYRCVSCKDGEKQLIRSYLETHQPHLLKAYDADFLADVIQQTKTRCFENLVANGSRHSATINWAELQSREVGI